jgi:molybdopterin-guanine dinucleotide biosynthesis protein A
MDVSEPVVGVLLAGGRSSRMGGGDKALRPLGGRPLLAQVIARLEPQVAEMILNANGDPARFAEFGLPVIADSIADFPGPLAGVLAGLSWVEANRPGVDYIVTAAADTPFIPSDLVSKLFAAAGDKRQAFCVARSEEGVHPVIGLWPVSMAPDLEKALQQGMRKVGRWAELQAATEVFFPDVEIGGQKIDPFFNVNTPQDLALAEGLLRETAR